MPLLKESYGQIFDGNGAPYPGAKIWTYDEGTTTPKSSYTTHALSVANANPVVSDGNGRFPAIWLSTGRYKIVAMTTADVTIYTADGIEGTDAGFGILTTRGDLLTRDATTAIRLAIGANGTVLGSNGTDPGWVTAASLSGTNVWTGANTFQTTDDGASIGPVVVLKRVSTSPGVDDALGDLAWVGRNSAAADITYGQFVTFISDPVAGSEDSYGKMIFYTAGVATQSVAFGAGIVVGTATGGLQGAGTVNATNFFKNGVALQSTGVVAWVFSDSAGNIQSAFNVASVVVNATGNYTINFTAAIVNGTYAVVGSGQDVNGVAQTTVAYRTGDLHSTTQLQVRTDRTGTPTSCNFSVAVYAG